MQTKFGKQSIAWIIQRIKNIAHSIHGITYGYVNRVSPEVIKDNSKTQSP